MNPPRAMRIIQYALALVAVLFGFATIVAGTRVLAGADPGYIVFLPLLIFNTVMGVIYVLAGFTLWRSLDRGRYAAAAIFSLNLLVLAVVAYLYQSDQGVALDSVRAMSLRTGVWLVLFLGLAWLSRKSPRA